MKLDASELDLPAAQGVRLIALELMDDADAPRARLGDTDEAEVEGEPLHDFRVALRRLRSLLRAFDDLLDDDVRAGDRRRLARAARATNRGRDLEVQQQWLRVAAPALPARSHAAAAWMARRLEERHGGAARSAVRDAIADFARARARLARRLATVELPVRAADARSGLTLAGAIAMRLGERADVLRARLAEVHAPEDARPAHAARIAAKRLRYLLEPAAPHVEGGGALLEQLERMQDILGELHDAHVMAVELRAALEDVAAEEARRLGADVLPRRDGGASAARPEQSIRTLRARRTGLLALASRLRVEMEGRFAEARTRWLEGGADALADEVAMVASRLAARRDEDAEIEHKYLLDALPDAARAAPHDEIDQGYLPGALLEERVRRVSSGDGVRCWRTIKFGRGLRRTEVEEEMTLELFTALWPLTEGRRVHKRRWRVSDGERDWELDEFLDRELVLAEIELARMDDEVAIPGWLAPHLVREVTGEDAYVNVNLAS